MTRRTVTLISIAILVVGFVVGGIIGCAAPEEVVKEVPTEVIKEVPKEVIKEVPMNLPVTAEAIQEGEIDVGTDYGFGLDQRYHKIHATVLGLDCDTCHIAEVDTTDKVLSAWNASPQSPGPVDQRGCLGCHTTGPSSDLYGSSGP
jgi:hypothetical protein